MLSFTSTLLAVLPLIAAISATPIEARQAGTVSATFFGAAGAQYTVDMPLNSAFSPTHNALSISQITTDGGPCAFFGIDGGVFVVPGAGQITAGPPQTIVGGVCGQMPGQ